MGKEKIIVTLDKMGSIRKSAGQTDKKILTSAQEFTTIPESGIFSHVGVKDFTVTDNGKDRVVKSVGIYTEDGTFISENALIQQHLLPELTEIKNGSRKGKLMLKSDRLSDLSKFGASADARLVALQGKSFSTEKKTDTRVYKSEFLDSKEFDKVCQSSNNQTALKAALACTETKTGYIFTIE